MDNEIKHVVQHLLIVALTDVPDQLVFGIGNDRGHPLTPNKVQVDPPHLLPATIVRNLGERLLLAARLRFFLFLGRQNKPGLSRHSLSCKRSKVLSRTLDEICECALVQLKFYRTIVSHHRSQIFDKIRIVVDSRSSDKAGRIQDFLLSFLLKPSSTFRAATLSYFPSLTMSIAILRAHPHPILFVSEAPGK